MSVLEIGLVLVNMYNIISSCRALDSDYSLYKGFMSLHLKIT